MWASEEKNALGDIAQKALHSAFSREASNVYRGIDTQLMTGQRQDFIHYQPRRVVLNFPREASSPWFSHYQSRSDSFKRPDRHTTRQNQGAAAKIVEGDRIWIVSQIYSPWGALPPGIDACVEVESVSRRRGGGFHFIAAPTSRWFPLKDAGGLLGALRTVNSVGEKADLWADARRPVGCSIQSMRQLDSAQALEDWEQRLELLPLNFISYRIADGTQQAFEKVQELLMRGNKVFWDRWCLPRRLAERRECVNDKALDAQLMSHLQMASVVWGIESPLYADVESYAQKECAAARELGTYKRVRARRVASLQLA